MNEATSKRVWWDGQGEPDWARWHDEYDVPGSSLAIRLELVQTLLRTALDDAPKGLIQIVSCCAGQGRDVIEVVANHVRGLDVRARLVELDPRNVAFARASAERLGLANIEVVEGDASMADVYVGAVPARIVMVCGVFGNMTDSDVEGLIRRLPECCEPNATVIWTRHRQAPDLTPRLLTWFGEAGFEQLAVEAPQHTEWVGLGAHRFVGEPRTLEAGRRLFTFLREAN